MVIFFEKCIVFHSSLLQLHVYAGTVYRHNFFDSTVGYDERKWIDYEHARTNFVQNIFRKSEQICLLHTAETGGQLHDSSQRKTSCDRGGQVRDKKTF